MSGQVLGTSTATVGVTGVALLPSTGNVRPLFYAAAVLLGAGLVCLLASGLVALKSRNSVAN